MGQSWTKGDAMCLVPPKHWVWTATWKQGIPNLLNRGKSWAWTQSSCFVSEELNHFSTSITKARNLSPPHNYITLGQNYNTVTIELGYMCSWCLSDDTHQVTRFSMGMYRKVVNLNVYEPALHWKCHNYITRWQSYNTQWTHHKTL